MAFTKVISDPTTAEIMDLYSRIASSNYIENWWKHRKEIEIARKSSLQYFKKYPSSNPVKSSLTIYQDKIDFEYRSQAQRFWGTIRSILSFVLGIIIPKIIG